MTLSQHRRLASSITNYCSNSDQCIATAAEDDHDDEDDDHGVHVQVSTYDEHLFQQCPTTTATVPTTASDCAAQAVIKGRRSRRHFLTVNCRILTGGTADDALPQLCRLLPLRLLLLAFFSSANAIIAMPPPPLMCPSSLLINISRSVLLNISAEGHSAAGDKAFPLYLIMEYWPPHGRPASPYTLHGPPPSSYQSASQSAATDNFTIQIDGTWPAVRYQYMLSAVFGADRNNGTTNTVLLHKGIAHSSPDKPMLVSVAARERACTLAWAPPPALHFPPPHAHNHRHFDVYGQQPQVYAYYMEYFPVASSDVVFYARTKASSVRLRRLRTGTQYRLALYAEYFGVRSLCPLELAFRTRRTVSRYSNRTAITVTVPTTTMTSSAAVVNGTQMPSTMTTATAASTVSQRISTVMSRLLPPSKSAGNKDNFSGGSIETTDKITAPAATKPQTSSTSTSTTTTMSSSNEATTAERDSVQIEEGSAENNRDKEIPLKESEQRSSSRESDKSDNADEDGQPDDEADQSANQMSPREGTNETEAAQTQYEPPIRMRQHGTRTLALSWHVPDLVPCDAFLVRHRTLGLTNNARIGTQRTTTPQALLPLLANACVEVNVSCLFENSVSPQWSTRRVLDLRTPASVQSLRVLRTYTDEYFQSSVLLGFVLPPKVGAALFQLYEVHIAWAPGKKVVGSQHVVFRGEHIQRHSSAGGKRVAEGRVNVTGLEPARLYTFAVRNVSRELSSQCSAPLGVRLITPPVITSTLYAGKISPRSINVNFGESDPSHPFDQYELHFVPAGGGTMPKDSGSANSKNGGPSATAAPTTLVRRLAKNDPKSYTFNKLVPGNTYTFALFTLLQGVRSRPVDVNITTYPLKVPAFHPLVGSSYVRLFWTVRNDAHNLCRFRLSYTASAGPHLHRAKSLELNGSVATHRFSGLDWNTFYTFTITVIMGPPEAEAESESEAVTIGMANRPRSLPQLKRYGSRELLLSFENDPEVFPERNGAIKDFAVIVAERVTLEGAIGASASVEPDKDIEAPQLLETLGDVWELPSWHDARDRVDDAGENSGTPWIAYRTSPSNFKPFGRRSAARIAQFVIGAEDCVPGRRRLDEMYCNGALRANVDYFVRVRAFSVDGIAMETAWVGINGTVPHAVGKQSPDQRQQQWRLPCYMYLNGCYAKERGVDSNAAPSKVSSANWLLITATTICSMIFLIL